MNPQDRPARRFDEPPAYEDLELWVKRCANCERLLASPLWKQCPDCDGPLVAYRDPEIARHSHLGAILIVAAIVGLALIAAALFVRGAS